MNTDKIKKAIFERPGRTMFAISLSLVIAQAIITPSLLLGAALGCLGAFALLNISHH